MEPVETKKRFHWNEMLKKMNQNPLSSWVLLGLALCGLILLFWGKEPAAKQSPSREEAGLAQSAAAPETESAREQRRLEEELTHTLSLIDGVGAVKVDITLKSGGRRVWERQMHSNKRTSQEQGGDNREEESSDELVLAKDRDGRDAPVLKEELAPEIQGVLIVASGARDGRVREMLASTVMTVLDLPAYRVMVIPGEVYRGGGRND